MLKIVKKAECRVALNGTVSEGLGIMTSRIDFVDVGRTDTQQFIDPLELHTFKAKPGRSLKDVCDKYWPSFIEQCAKQIFEEDFSDYDFLFSSDSGFGEATYVQCFGEPRFTRLGYCKIGSEGRSVGVTGARGFARVAKAVKRYPKFIRSPVHLLGLVPGVGKDKVSDILTNVLGIEFAAYTEDVCRRLGKTDVLAQCHMSGWSYDDNAWVDAKLVRAIETNVGPLVLVPARVVSSDPQHGITEVLIDATAAWLRSNYAEDWDSAIQALGSKLPRNRDMLLQFLRYHKIESRESGKEMIASLLNRYPELWDFLAWKLDSRPSYRPDHAQDEESRSDW